MDADIGISPAAPPSSSSTPCSDARDYTLVDFDTEVRVARYSQSEFSRLSSGSGAARLEGNDGAVGRDRGVSRRGVARQEGRKILVLYTDGGDNASSITFGDLIDLLKASDVTVHAIGFLEHQPTRRPDGAARPADAARRAHRRPGVLPGLR